MDKPHLSWFDTVSKKSDTILADAMWFRSEKLRLHDVPILYTLKHLALSTGADYGFLRGVIRRNLRAYKPIKIPKNTGGYRDLQAPIKPLADVQRWILHEILYKIPRHKNNYAYFPKVTTQDSAMRHAGALWMVKTDIHNYFPSVTERQVFRVFLNLGYSNLLSFELARLCTWPAPGVPLDTSGKWEEVVHSTATPVYPKSEPSFLPQGAPTSGALSNACTNDLDRDISKLALSERFIYTRYSDDMVFSTTQQFDRGHAAGMVSKVENVVRRHGFEIHKNKTKVVPPGARKIVLGMLVNDAGIGILPEQKRMIKIYIHAVSKYGPLAYSAKRNFDSVISFINHVEGWLAYLSSIDAQWTRRHSEEWKSALAEHNVFLRSLQ